MTRIVFNCELLSTFLFFVCVINEYVNIQSFVLLPVIYNVVCNINYSYTLAEDNNKYTENNMTDAWQELTVRVSREKHITMDSNFKSNVNKSSTGKSVFALGLIVKLPEHST